jgi:hypothetical protein
MLEVFQHSQQYSVTYLVFGRDPTQRMTNLGMLLFLRLIHYLIYIIFLCGLPISGSLSRDGPRSEASAMLDIPNLPLYGVSMFGCSITSVLL